MRPKLLHSLHTFSIIWGGGVFNYSCCPCGDAMHLLRCRSNDCTMDCRCTYFSTPKLLETHVHKIAVWIVRNYDDHWSVVVAICGQSQNVPKLVLIITWACDWFFHCRMPLIAWVRMPPRARPDCSEGSRHCLRIWFGLLDGMLLTKLLLWKTVCGIHCLPLSDMAEPSGTKSGTKLIL